MGGKKQQEIVHRIQSLEHFQELTGDDTSQKVYVIDLHLDWCGPCSVIESNFRSMWFQIDNAAERLEFWTANEDVIPENVMAKLQHGPLTSKPRFLVWFGGKATAEIDGCVLTEIEEKVFDVMPAIDEA